MKIGVLADIHGNANALEAVMEDCRKKNIDSYLLLGDLFAKGPDPEKVYQILDKSSIIENIIGNTEKWFLQEAPAERQRELVEYGMKAFPEIKQYIKKMKEQVIWKISGRNILLTHYWPKDDSSEEKLDYLKKHMIHIVLSAHTHIPVEMSRYEGMKRDQIIYLNPGSIGAPYDKDRRGSYGILTIDKEIHFEVIRVTYDYEKECKEAYQRKLPFLKEYIKVIHNQR